MMKCLSTYNFSWQAYIDKRLSILPDKVIHFFENSSIADLEVNEGSFGYENEKCYYKLYQLTFRSNAQEYQLLMAEDGTSDKTWLFNGNVYDFNYSKLRVNLIGQGFSQKFGISLEEELLINDILNNFFIPMYVEIKSQKFQREKAKYIGKIFTVVDYIEEKGEKILIFQDGTKVKKAD